MLWRVYRFEVLRQLRQPAFWYLSLFFAGLGFAAMQLFAGAIDSLRIVIMGADSQLFDSPFFVQKIVSTVTFLGLPVCAWLFGSAIHQESAHRCGSLLWTTQLDRRAYWYGRWGAALSLGLLLFLGVASGVWLSTQMPWLDAEQFGAGRWAGYLNPYLITVLPRVALVGTLAFVVVARLRSMLPGYLAIVALMGLYRIASRLAGDLENRTIAALLDPSGGVAYNLATRYWTAAEKNTLIVPFEGLFLANRLLWFGVGIALLVLGGLGLRQDLEHAPVARWRRWLQRRLTAFSQILVLPLKAAAKPFHAFSRQAERLPLGLKVAFSEYRSVVTHPAFLVSIALGGLAIFASAGSIDQTYGTATWPVTYQVTDALRVLFSYFSLGILLFFSGHLAWRERSLRVAPLLDSSPRSIWLSLISKLSALLAVAITLQLFLFTAGLLYQTHEGYQRYELGLYASQLLGIQLTDLALFVVLALCLQAALPSRWLAYLVTVLTHFGFAYLPAIGVDHLLARWGSDPGVVYSELAGWGHFLAGWVSAKLFWAVAASILLIVAALLWPRGESRPWLQRWRRGQRRLTPRLMATMVCLTLLWPVCGAWIFYNTNMVNTYRDRASSEQIQVDRERSWRSWLDRPSPKIVSVRGEVDLYPRQRDAYARGTYVLRNKTAKPIDSFVIQLPSAVDVEELAFDQAFTLGERDRAGGFQEVRLTVSLEPGDEVQLHFATSLIQDGFANDQKGSLGVVNNGTFLTSRRLLPDIGYDASAELIDPARRRRFGLEDRDPLPARNDLQGRSVHALGSGADWVDFDMVISTSAGQVALAPGDLIAQWSQHSVGSRNVAKSKPSTDSQSPEKGRSYFHYRSAVPILPIFVFVSGAYEVVDDSWGMAGSEVALEIYFDPDHRYNVDTMMRGLKRSLELYSAAFGPYPHKSLRIVEFPRYSSFAMSLPTLIPFSEAIGFIARLDDPQAIDYPFYVTAHEVAHQWWPHQVAPAATAGAGLLSETLSQYSALRVMVEQYGRERIGRFLRYELDRYLIGRGASTLTERPLSHIQAGQQHLHYNKGALAMWAMADRIGFEAMDGILAEYLKRWGGMEAPYPTTADFLSLVREKTNAADHALLGDLFEQIVLYDLETREATCEELSNGRFRITLEIEAAKFYADGEGNLSPAELTEPLKVGVFGEKKVLRKKIPKALLLESRRLSPGNQQIILEVDSRPLRAGIDPYHEMIDRMPFDNMKNLACDSGEATKTDL